MQGFFGIAIVLYIIGSVLEAVMKSKINQQNRSKQAKPEESLLTLEVAAPAEAEQVLYIDSSDMSREQSEQISYIDSSNVYREESEHDLSYWFDDDTESLADMNQSILAFDSQEVEVQEKRALEELGIDEKNLASTFRTAIVMSELIREPRSKRPWPQR